MPAKQRQSPHDHARRLVEAAVPRHIAAWAAIAGLASDGPRIERFRADVTEALHACMRAHLRPPPQRRKYLHGRLERVAELATVVAPELSELQDLLIELIPLFGHDPSFRLPSLYAIAFDLSDQARAKMNQRVTVDRTGGRKLRRKRSLAAAAKHYAKTFEDTGGAPNQFAAFDALVNGEKGLANGLTDAYQRATGRAAKVTWSDYRERYEGHFVALTKEAILPVACEIAESVTGKSLPVRKALGKFLQRLKP
jgi:hypothetical protein